MQAQVALIALSAVALNCGAGEIVLPAAVVERDTVITAFYRTNSQATGKGTLQVTWTDALGRVVDERKFPFELVDENEVGFPIDARRAVAMRNEVRVHFSFAGANKKNESDKREEDAQVTFIARPPDAAWWDYAIIMWQNYPREAFSLLKTIGIMGSHWVGRNRNLPEFLLQNDLRWYAENIATDFYAEYHRWKPDRPVNWQFNWAKEVYRKDPASREAFKRRPSLSDPVWLKKVQDRLVDAAKFWYPYRPFFYSLGDETGIADLSAYWDFDFSDHSLDAMRPWLKQRYGTLTALNRQWGTDFAAWDLVTPKTTNEAMKSTDENYSAWADHKEWMDIAFADAMKMGNDAVRSVDPQAYVGIGGAQMPGWGGYDYWKLTRALTAMEPYNLGNNVEIIRSLNPNIALVTTSFARGPWEKQRIWYELLHGGRGLILWDNGNEFVTKDGKLNARGEEVAPYYQELLGGLGALLINSRRLADPIAIHYSQASMRTEWMRAQKPKGAAWVNRNSSTERKDSEFLRLRESWCRLLEDLGLQYRFVAYEQVERGELLRGGYRVLVLPSSSSLSRSEATQIRDFVNQGGLLIVDGEAGIFDERSRRLERPLLHDVLAKGRFGRGRAVQADQDTLNYHQHRLVGKEERVHQWAAKTLAVRPEFAVTDPQARPVVGVETHMFANGAVRLIALNSNPQLLVDELGPPEFKSNQRFEKPREVRLTLPSGMHVYDVRAGKDLGRKTELELTLEPYEPLILAAAPDAVPQLEIVAPASCQRGDTAIVAARFRSSTPAARHIFRVDVLDPLGKRIPHYSGNVLAPNGTAARRIPVAENDPAGKWEIRVRDVLSGQVQSTPLEVY